MKGNISFNITYEEATYSATAERLHLKNDPPEDVIKRMRLVATRVFQPAREHFKKPIEIGSFYRSGALNRAVGGAIGSAHETGEAIDMDAIGFSNAELFHYIRENLEFDQLIWEFGTDKEPDWVHVAYREGRNRKEVLKASIINHKRIYAHYLK
jgi:zinc D-Ala-D-Ala carboxypeptidase